MNKLQSEWKEITLNEYNEAKLNNKVTFEHTKMVMAILDDSNCFSPDTCGFVSLYVAKKYNLIYI